MIDYFLRVLVGRSHFLDGITHFLTVRPDFIGSNDLGHYQAQLDPAFSILREHRVWKQ